MANVVMAYVWSNKLGYMREEGGALGSLKMIHGSICITGVPYSFYVGDQLFNDAYVGRVYIVERYLLRFVIQVSGSIHFTIIQSMILIV